MGVREQALTDPGLMVGDDTNADEDRAASLLLQEVFLARNDLFSPTFPPGTPAARNPGPPPGWTQR